MSKNLIYITFASHLLRSRLDTIFREMDIYSVFSEEASSFI